MIPNNLQGDLDSMVFHSDPAMAGNMCHNRKLGPDCRSLAAIIEAPESREVSLLSFLGRL